jgi:hypothetical protein
MKLSGMFVVLHRLGGRWRVRRRKRQIIAECGCVAFCPGCGDPLNDQAAWHSHESPWTDEMNGRGAYGCTKCGRKSEWHFGIAPGPILLTPNNMLSVSGERKETDAKH